MRRAHALIASLLATLLLATLLLAACVPSRVVIDLAPGDATLDETQVLADPGASSHAPKIALIDLTGLISLTPPPGLVASRSSIVDAFITRLDKAAADPNVRAVVILINSPGGTVAASEILYDEITRFRESSGRPVVAAMTEIAASGAYYTALAADDIIAQPSSVTGSIGVIVQTFNLSRAMDRLGIDGRAITSGPNKAMTNPFMPPSEAHYEIVQHLVDQFYDSFKSLVAQRFPQTAADSARFDTLTDGRVFTGAEAARLGLIDDTGSLRDAFARAKALADLETAQLVKYHAQGAPPASPYTLTAAPPPASLADQTNVSILSLSPNDTLDPGFYYLWLPAAP